MAAVIFGTLERQQGSLERKDMLNTGGGAGAGAGGYGAGAGAGGYGQPIAHGACGEAACCRA